MDESSLFNKAHCNTASSATNYLNENVLDHKRQENWTPNSCDLNSIEYTIWDIMEKMVYKNVRQYEHIEGLFAVISDAWTRLTKINQ